MSTIVINDSCIGISKRQARRERIARVATIVADKVSDLLRQGGLIVRVKARQALTGTVYVKIRVYGSDGRRLKHHGAAIRIADHRERTSRLANFSRPAKRYYGIWFFSPAKYIARKIVRIARDILGRNLSRRKEVSQ